MDTKLCFYSCFLSFLYPPKCFAKGVERRTSSENSDNFNDKNYVFHYSKVWVCGQEAVFQFHVFFLVPFIIYGKSVDRWTRALNIMKKVHVLHCVEMWTRSCFSISCEYVFEQFRKTLKKNCEKPTFFLMFQI